MGHIKQWIGLLGLVVLAACAEVPPDPYSDKGAPETMLSVSSEVVNFDLDSPSLLGDLSDALTKNPPSSATLNCSSTGQVCANVRAVFNRFDIHLQESSGKEVGVTLLYDRMVTHSCQNRYVDNMFDHNELNHPAFGCSVRSNMLNMVVDKKQFTSPAALDPRDGEKVEQNYQDYLKPPVAPANSGSLLNSTTSQ